MHIADEAILAYMDGELDTARRGDVQGHLADCDDCAGRLSRLLALSRQVSTALARLDVAAPLTGLPETAERKPISLAPLTRSANAAPRWTAGLQGRPLAIAASLVLLVAAGAWAIPGSPLPGWIERVFGDSSPETVATTGADSAIDGPVATADPSRAGVSVEPDGGRVSIYLVEPAIGTRVEVTLVEDPHATVSAEDADFRVAPGVIEVERVRDRVHVALPVAAPVARVFVDGALVVQREGAALAVTPRAAKAGVEISITSGGGG